MLLLEENKIMRVQNYSQRSFPMIIAANNMMAKNDNNCVEKLINHASTIQPPRQYVKWHHDMRLNVYVLGMEMIVSPLYLWPLQVIIVLALLGGFIWRSASRRASGSMLYNIALS